MEKEASLTASELREISDEDELVVSSICHAICTRQTTRSIQPCDQSLKSWVGPVQNHLWTDLPKCMKFIAKNGCSGNCSLIWARRTLDRLSSTATPEQLIHILNGYADLYKLVLYFIQINANILVDKKDIRTFRGTSRNVEQEKRHRNIAFIMYNSENSMFTPFYATHSDGHPQTCFATDDEKITDDIADLFNKLNNEISQRSAQEIDHTSDNNDATKSFEESQKSDNLDALLPSESPAQNEADLTTPKICENDVEPTSQIIAQSDFHSNDKEIIINSADSMTTHPNWSSDTDLTQKTVYQNLDRIKELLLQARRLLEEVDDIPSMEIDDRQLPTNEALKERELISQNGMINTAKSETRHTEKHVHSSNNNRSRTATYLSQSTTPPTPMTIPNDQTISRPVQLYEPPNVTKHPKRHRRVRMLNDVANKDCPLIQADGGQRSYPEAEVPSNGDEGLHLRVRAVTENQHPHPCTTVAPENASVNWTLMKNNNERLCLQCNPDSFDPALECVYLPITDNDRRNCRKEIKVRLFNWKQYGPTIKEVIERENLRLCRLEFYLCMRIRLGQYQLVSKSSYTSVIEEANGDVAIDPTKIEPKQLCELGGEKIIVPLNVSCLKKGFCIECNGNKLKTKEFTMERKKVSFTSPPKVEGIDELHLIIKRTEYVENSSILKENQLYDDYLPYVAHGQYKHTCSHLGLTVANSQMS